MTEPFNTVCENCGATLKLKNPDLVGKKVKCPKCGEAFVVSEAPSPQKKPVRKKADDDDGFMDVDPDDYKSPPDGDDLNDDDDVPIRRKRSTGGGKKKSKKSRGKGNSARVVTIVAIVLGVLAVLGGGGYGLLALSKGGASDLDWLTTEIEGYAKIQIDDLWNSGVIQPLANGDAGKQFTDEMTKNVGMGPQDVDQVIIGFAKTGQNDSPIMVMKSKHTFDLTKMQGSAEKAEYVSHAGGQYLKNGPIAIFLPDSKTMVRGSEANVQAVMSRGRQNPSASKFSFAKGCRDHVVVAIVNPGSAGPAAGTGALMGLGGSPAKDAENMLVRANAASDVSVSFQATFRTADAAKGVVEKTQAELTKGKTQIGQQKTQLQSMPANPFVKLDDAKKMMDGVEQVMNTIKVSQWGSQMSVQLTVSGQLIKDVTELAKSSPFATFPGAGRFPSPFGN